jgi:predicted HNH restriction endonuclease
MSSGCLYCAEKDPCCLDFHHQSNDKKYSISNKLADKTWTALLEEIKKCIVVCANCHRKLHAGKISIKINI